MQSTVNKYLLRINENVRPKNYLFVWLGKLLPGIHELAIDSFETLQIYNDNRTKWSPMTAKQESQTQ